MPVSSRPFSCHPIDFSFGFGGNKLTFSFSTPRGGVSVSSPGVAVGLNDDFGKYK